MRTLKKIYAMQRGVPGSAEPRARQLVVLLERSARGANAQPRRPVDWFGSRRMVPSGRRKKGRSV